MKTVRILLLVLLAMLLPLRGALAEVSHCSSAANQTAHSAAHDAADASGHVSHAPHDHAGGATDTCNFCASSCSAVPVVSVSPGLATAALLVAAAFPALEAPAPSHPTEGPERPPRSL